MFGKRTTKILIALYFLFVGISLKAGFSPGVAVGKNFLSFSLEMMKILPCAFILIGLFEVWVKRSTVEKHLGEESGWKGYLWAILLAGTTVGGLYVAFPVAMSLRKKGAKLSIIFTYVGASAVCRIPMTVFEASFLGLKFSIVRLIVSIPLIVVSSVALGNYLEKRGYNLRGWDLH